MLTREENPVVQGLVGNRCQTLATTVVQVSKTQSTPIMDTTNVIINKTTIIISNSIQSASINPTNIITSVNMIQPSIHCHVPNHLSNVNVGH